MLAILYFALSTAFLHYVAVETIKGIKRYRELRQFAKAHGCKNPPTESHWDVLGLMRIYDSAYHIIHNSALSNMTTMFQNYSDTFSSRILFQRVYFTCSPKNIKHVLVTRFVDYDNSTVRVHLFKPITENGIFALDGPEWKKARNLYQNQFSHTSDIFNIEAQEIGFQNLYSQLPIGQPFDLAPLLLKLIFDLTSRYAFGESVDTLRADQAPDKKEFAEALMHAKKIMARDGFLGPVHVFLGKRDFYDACAKTHRYAEKVIKKALEDKAHREKEAPLDASPVTTDGRKTRNSLLEGLMENSTDLIELRDGVITIMIAGIDSVASLLSQTFWLLARHPDVYQKLREEVLTKVGRQVPTYAMLKSLTCMRWVFNETMRVYPPVPFNARTANRDTWLPTGGGPDGNSSVLIKKGARVIFSSWATHRSKESFGNDAEEFRPERWENLKAETMGFIPFNLGPRACPGQQYALMEASFVAVRMLQSFSEINPRDPRPWTEKVGLNLSNKNGVVVELVRDREATV